MRLFDEVLILLLAAIATVTLFRRLGMGISVFQDVTAISFVTILPALAGVSGNSVAEPLLLIIGKALAAVVLMATAGRCAPCCTRSPQPGPANC